MFSADPLLTLYVCLYRLRQFDSGVLVVQSLSHSEEAIVQATAKLVCENRI